MEVILDQVEKRYGQVFAVRQLNLKISSGALHFCLGPSGCGKTTTLRMLAGLEKTTAGRIIFDGNDVTALPATERGIGMVFQNYALWPHMTVRKNIEYGLKLKKLDRAEIKRRTAEVVSFTQLTGLEERLPGQLSGGQQQRVALARALAVRPNVLLLDEPLSNLDAQLRLEMRDNISRIHRQTGITTIYVTHDQKEALSMGSSVSVMRKGELIQTDAPRTLYHHPRSAFIANFIGETNLIEGKLVEKMGRDCIVSTVFGKLKATAGLESLTHGSKVHVSLRPEVLKISLDGRSIVEDNHLKLKLDHNTYLGESEQFFLMHESGERLLSTSFNTPEHEMKSGDFIQCGVSSRDILVLPFEEGIGRQK